MHSVREVLVRVSESKHERKGARFLKTSPPLVVGVGMGDRRSFRIESKRFDLVWVNDGTKQVRISKKSSYHRSIIYMGKEGIRWLERCMDENIVREGEKAFIRTLREHGKTFIIRRYSNKFGRYLEVLECGMGGSRERIVILEGPIQNGWKGFNKELRILLNSEPKTTKYPVQGGVGRIDGMEVGKNPRRGDGPWKSYREAVSMGQRKEEKRENTQNRETKNMETKKEKDGTKAVQVATVPAIEGRIESNPGADVTAQNKERIKQRQPLRFFPDVAPGIPRNLGKGITIHVNESGQRQVKWTTKRNTNVGKQWVPYDRHEDKSKNQKVGLVLLDGPSKYRAIEDKASLGLGPRSTFEVGECSGSNTQLSGLENEVEVSMGLEGSHNSDGSSGHNKRAHHSNGLIINTKESNALITGRGAYQLNVDWHIVEVNSTNQEKFSEFSIKVRLACNFLSQCFSKITEREMAYEWAAKWRTESAESQMVRSGRDADKHYIPRGVVDTRDKEALVHN